MRVRFLLGAPFRFIFRDVAQLGSASGLGPEGRRFESCHLDHLNGVLAQLVEHLLCTQGVRSSNLLSSTIYIVLQLNKILIGGVAQLVRAIGSYPIGRGFESPRRHQNFITLDFGPLAQWSELPAHNRLVVGSSPTGSTNLQTY